MTVIPVATEMAINMIMTVRAMAISLELRGQRVLHEVMEGSVEFDGKHVVFFCGADFVLTPGATEDILTTLTILSEVRTIDEVASTVKPKITIALRSAAPRSVGIGILTPATKFASSTTFTVRIVMTLNVCTGCEVTIAAYPVFTTWNIRRTAVITWCAYSITPPTVRLAQTLSTILKIKAIIFASPLFDDRANALSFRDRMTSLRRFTPNACVADAVLTSFSIITFNPRAGWNH